MENNQNLTQEELLQAAEEAYAKAQNPPLANQEAEIDTSVTQEEVSLEEAIESLPPDDAEIALDETMEEIEQADESQPAKSNSTTATALGLAIGLVLGAVLGFVTTTIPGFLTLGILTGTLIGLLIDVKHDKNKPTPKESQTTNTIVLQDKENIE